MQVVSERRGVINPKFPSTAQFPSSPNGFKTGTLLCDIGGMTISPLTSIFNGALQCGDVVFQGMLTLRPEIV